MQFSSFFSQTDRRQPEVISQEIETLFRQRGTESDVRQDVLDSDSSWAETEQMSGMPRMIQCRKKQRVEGIRWVCSMTDEKWFCEDAEQHTGGRELSISPFNPLVLIGRLFSLFLFQCALSCVRAN